MAEETSIEWCDHTFNPWRGCEEVHPGCDNCYARELAKRNPAVLGKWGPDGTRVIASEAQWKLPLRWDVEAKYAGVRKRVFCASISDVFEDWPGRIVNSQGSVMWWRSDKGIVEAVGTTLGHVRNERPARMDDVRDRLLKLIDWTPNLDWILVTKRPENIRRFWIDRTVSVDCGPDMQFRDRVGYRPNAWLLTSISDQATADAMIPHLLQCRDLVPVLGVSAEPLLGPVDLEMIRDPKRFPGCAYFDVLRGRMVHEDDDFNWTDEPRLDWVIVGGESGRGARPCNVAWVRDLVGQCKAAGVACFTKQLGTVFANENSLADKKAGTVSDWPDDIRIREFPNG